MDNIKFRLHLALAIAMLTKFVIPLIVLNFIELQ